MKDFLGKRIRMRDQVVYYSARKKKYYNAEVAGFGEETVRVRLDGAETYINVHPDKLVVASRDH